MIKSGERYEQFKTTLASRYWEADTAFSSEMAALANEGWDYYYGKKPIAAITGASRYVDRSVFEAVNGTLQELLNVFLSGEEYARVQTSIGEVGATQYINNAIIRRNNGFTVLGDPLKECLVTRNSYVKYYWEKEDKVIEEEFSDMTPDELEAYLDSKKRDADDYAPRVLESVTDEFGLKSGTLEYVVDTSGVKIEYVPFEQLIFEPGMRSFRDGAYVCHRTTKTKEELLDMGFSSKKLEEAGAGYEKLYTSAYEYSRNAGRVPTLYSGADANTDDHQRKYTLCEHYIKSGLLDARNKVKLYQVFTAGNNTVLEVNEVDRIPFETCTPFTIPGSVYGESVVDIVKDIQDVKTAIMRGYIDNIHNANHGRMMGLKGQYNKRDAMDNRPSVIVEVEMPNALTPFPYNQLPNGVDNLLEHVEQAKEQRSGVTRLGQGLNSDIFKNDNAFATVNQAMTASMNRLRMVARNIAENFMKNLITGIYELVRTNDKRPFKVDTFMGSGMVVPYYQWPEKMEVIVDVAIGEGEKAAYANKLIQAMTLLTQAPMLAGSAFTTQNAHYLAHEAMKYMGIRNLPMALTPMSQVQPPQPDPLAQKAKELELAKIEAEVMEKQANAAEKQSKAQIEVQRLMFEQQKAADDFKLQVQDFMSKGQREADRTTNEQFKTQIEMMKEKLEATMKSSDIIAKQEMEADKLVLEQRKLDLEERELALKEAELRLKAQEIQLKGRLEIQKVAVQKDTAEKQMMFSREQAKETNAINASKVNSGNSEANNSSKEEVTEK